MITDKRAIKALCLHFRSLGWLMGYLSTRLFVMYFLDQKKDWIIYRLDELRGIGYH